MAITKENIIEILKQVNDPEIQLDVWTMGLIYDIKIEDKKVMITMTMTTPACPYGPMMLEDVKKQVLSGTGAEDVRIEVTFEPPWQPSEELRAMLGV